MTRVDFYLLSDPAPQAYFVFACRLIEKAYQRGHRIYVFLANEANVNKLDDLLWTFGETSFVPHTKINASVISTPILLSSDTAPADWQDILVNLSDTLPSFYQQFSRVIEIVSADETKKSLARRHYAIYREQGCALERHQIS
jgi:DNA polymerase-3 subunit chi